MAGLPSARRRGGDTAVPEGVPLSELLLKLVPRLFSAMARYGVEVQDREDVLQDVLLAYVLKKDAILSPENWLFAAVFKQCQQRQRGLARRRASLERAAAAPPDVAVDPRSSLNSRLDLMTLLRRLRPQERAAVSLHHRAGCTAAEAAVPLGVSVASCEKLLARGLRRLREQALAD